MRINELDGEVTQAQLDSLEKVLDRVFAQLNIDVEFTRHFLDRVNDERNVKQITITELAMLFKKEFQKWGKPIASLGPDAEAVMKDLATDINIPFALNWNRATGMLELVAKTVMRKKNFRTPNKEFPVEGYQLTDRQLKRITENLVSEQALPQIASGVEIPRAQGMSAQQAANTFRNILSLSPGFQTPRMQNALSQYLQSNPQALQAANDNFGPRQQGRSSPAITRGLRGLLGRALGAVGAILTPSEANQGEQEMLDRMQAINDFQRYLLNNDPQAYMDFVQAEWNALPPETRAEYEGGPWDPKRSADYNAAEEAARMLRRGEQVATIDPEPIPVAPEVDIPGAPVAPVSPAADVTAPRVTVEPETPVEIPAPPPLPQAEPESPPTPDIEVPPSPQAPAVEPTPPELPDLPEPQTAPPLPAPVSPPRPQTAPRVQPPAQAPIPDLPPEIQPGAVTRPGTLPRPAPQPNLTRGGNQGRPNRRRPRDFDGGDDRPYDDPLRKWVAKHTPKSFESADTISESGSAPGVGPIHRDEIAPTLEPISKFLGIDLVKQALGSVGKKQFSGDIDVAINLPPEQLPEFGAKLEASPLFSYVEKTSVFITKIKIQDYDPNRTFVDPRTGEDKGVPSGRTGYVQLDFMPGDPGWLKTYYHSPSETESKYKGVFRNIMIATIAAVYNRQDSEQKLSDGRALESIRYMWSPTDGLVKIRRTPVLNKKGDGYTKKNKNEIIDGPWKQPDEIVSELGLGDASVLNSFETLLAAVKKNYTREQTQRIIQGFVDNSVVQDIGVPEELTNK